MADRQWRAAVRLAMVAASALAVTAWPGVLPANAQDAYPSKPIKIIVATAPGGATDLTARLLAQKMSASMGQPVIVDNKPGANSIIGTDAVAKAPADGYTVLMIDRGTISINPSLYVKLPYDTLKDLAYIGIATDAPYVLVVNPTLGVKTVAELIALAKTKELSYGSFGIGSMAQLNLESFAQKGGIKMLHVPYKGASPAVGAVVSNEVALAVATLPSSLGFIKEGRVIPLAVGSDKRLPQLPDVPTAMEAGLAVDTILPVFFGLVAPAGTPPAVIAKLNAELKTALADPDVAAKLTAAGLVPTGTTPEAMASTITADIERFGALVKLIGIKPE
jgi:tripartite-type tricarboxylate transporter receptor subunit TctC